MPYDPKIESYNDKPNRQFAVPDFCLNGLNRETNRFFPEEQKLFFKSMKLNNGTIFFIRTSPVVICAKLTTGKSEFIITDLKGKKIKEVWGLKTSNFARLDEILPHLKTLRNAELSPEEEVVRVISHNDGDIIVLKDILPHYCLNTVSMAYVFRCKKYRATFISDTELIKTRFSFDKWWELPDDQFKLKMIWPIHVFIGGVNWEKTSLLDVISNRAYS